MDEKKQEGIQSSDNKELNTPEESQHNNTPDNIKPEAAQINVEQEQSAPQENKASLVSTSGQKSGINKRVVGAAVVVVAAVVGGAVYVTQQSKIDGMWSKGDASSSTQQLANTPEPVSSTPEPEIPQSSVQAAAGQEPAASDNNLAVTADAESAQAGSATLDTTTGQSATSVENETATSEDSTAEQAQSVASEESALAEATQSGEQDGVVNADSTGTDAKSGNAEAVTDAGNASDVTGMVKVQLDQQTGQINQLKAELKQMQEQYTELLEQRVNRADIDVSLFVVNDVARLVQSADNELSIAGNLPNAVRALEMAQQTIRRADSPILSGLAGAIASDIVMLKSAPVMNEDTLFNEVGKLIELLDKAPLVSPDRVDHISTVLPDNTSLQSSGQDVPATVSPDLNWYEKAWEEVKSWSSGAMNMLKSDLGGLVRVEQLDDPTVALMSTGQAAALKNNLKLDLRFAQQGLLNAQQGIWTSSLESVQAALLKYYNQDAPETRQALEQTRTLLAIPVRPQLPQITHSAKAIEETRNQIINLGKPQE